MRICFYNPFKPLGHLHPSGDLMIALGLCDFLARQGHQIWPVSDFRARWIYWKPWCWPQLIRERRRSVRRFSPKAADIWLTYHSYYKAPDLIGPWASKRMKIPYAIFQGIYATKRKRRAITRPGFFLNRKALTAAGHVFTNKQVDLENLKRLLPGNRITYVAPGIRPGDFTFDPEARAASRRSWKVGNEPVILSAAMFRPGVKAEGVAWVIRSCGDLFRKGLRFHLVIAGEGKERNGLVRLAGAHLPGRVRFLGKLPRNVMHRFYSAGDVFVFPGIKESLGMVFLEAQSCGLPVVAFANGGIPEVARDRVTGYLTPLYDRREFVHAVELLLTDEALRKQMGRAAGEYVRERHDQNQNYRVMEDVLAKMVKV